MADRTESEITRSISHGDERDFARAYDHFRTRVRLVAFRISHRSDWIDDLENEAWCRAFKQRGAYDAETPFLVWMSGILRNVYREFCRNSHLTLDDGTLPSAEKIDLIRPESVAHEAEVLSALNECITDLDPGDAHVLRLRFFENKPLRVISQEVMIPEATLREKTIVKLLNQLRACLRKKNIDFPEIFSAQDRSELQ